MHLFIDLFILQVVRVVHSTGGEWCYVEDRHGSKGYVPHTYLKAYEQHTKPEVLENVKEENIDESSIAQ